MAVDGLTEAEGNGAMNVKRITIEAQGWVAHDPKLRNLTDRQQEIVARFAEERTPEQVAADLGISLQTVHNYVTGSGVGCAASRPVRRRVELADEARKLMKKYALTGTMTPRQEQIVEMSAEGGTVEEIAGELGINPKSVEAHSWRGSRSGCTS